jgi:hypothetical protein
MQKFFLLLFLFFSLQLNAQEEKKAFEIDSETGKIKFQAVVEEEGTQEQLFNRCVYFLNDFYNDAARVTSIRDIISGKIEGNYRFRIYANEKNTKVDAGLINYDFIIEMKDGRYRYTVTDLYLKSTTNKPIERWLDKDDPGYDQRTEDYLRQIVDYFDNWSEKLKEKMKPEIEKKKDEW